MSGRRVTVVASELLGRAGTGGAGTADSLLAVALARNGHDVELLIASGRDIGTVSDEWQRIYDDAGVSIRILDRTATIRPPYLAPPIEVYHALREATPDVVIADDWRGLAFAALRARQTSVALADTAFLIHCHGPGRVLTEFAQKVPDTLERFGESVAERTSIELADGVVSPSNWLLDWMRDHEWTLPADARVVQYLRQSVALGVEPPSPPDRERTCRLAFFGQLREGKGIRIYSAALSALDPQLLEGVELVFLGSARGRWVPETIAAALPSAVQSRFETSLDRDAALAELRRPGTLAVMPSLLDNSPNTVSECIENGIPFVAARTGGIPELISEEDQARVLFEPTAESLAATLTRVLGDGDFQPATAAREAHESLDVWLEIVGNAKPSKRARDRTATAVSVVATGHRAVEQARLLAERAETVEVDVVHASTRRDGLFGTYADWVLFLDDEDSPDEELIDVLVDAQSASGADVVSIAVRPSDDEHGIHAFLGDPGALGLVENQYGVLALVRSSLAVSAPMPAASVDPDWPFLARLALGGARVVSIPDPLATHAGRAGRIDDLPGEGLATLDAFEAADPARLSSLPQLTATLAAALARDSSSPPPQPAPSLTKRLQRRIARPRR